MDLFLDDLVNGLVHQVQTNVVPKLEGAQRTIQQRFVVNGKNNDVDDGDADERHFQRRRRPRQTGSVVHGPLFVGRRQQRQPKPPSNTDLVYLTDRLLISSQPAVAVSPTFEDTGRDEHSKTAHFVLSSRTAVATPTPTTTTTTATTTATTTTTTTTTTPMEVVEAAESGDQDYVDDEVPPLSQDSSRGIGDSSINEDNITTSNNSINNDGPDDAGFDDDNNDINSNDNENDMNPQDGTGIVEAAIDGHGESSIPASIDSNEAAAEEGAGGGRNDGDADNAVSNTRSTAFVVENVQECNASSDNKNNNSDVNTEGDNDGPKSDVVTNEQSFDGLPPPPPTPAPPSNDDRVSGSGLSDGGMAGYDGVATGEPVVSSGESQNDYEPQREVEGPANRRLPLHQLEQHLHQHQHQHQTKNGRIINSPANVVDFLDRNHGRYRYMAFSLMNDRPDDRTLRLFRRQIVQLGWWSPCIERTETPSISKMFRVCYALHAYLQLDPSNVALVYCSNGRTRTSIAVGCYLKYAGMVEHAIDGFQYVLKKRGLSNPESIVSQIPPSLRLSFHQFDEALEYGRFLNTKPLLLRAVALQGVPVEDQPCLDIWDSSQQHVYSSHPHMWIDDPELHKNMSKCLFTNNSEGLNDTTTTTSNINGVNIIKPRSQWVDEEGFYQANVILDGDFVLLCRFGGDFASETKIHDPTKILFRYSNTTGFLSGGYPYELNRQKIDLTRIYSDQFDDEDFLVTLIFEANWEQSENDNGSNHDLLPSAVSMQLGTTSKACGDRFWKRHEKEACDEGLRVIFESHAARPTQADLTTFKRCHHQRNFDRGSDHLILLALQLTNNDVNEAFFWLTESPILSWWDENGGPDVHEVCDEEEKVGAAEDFSDDLDKKNDVEKALRSINDKGVEDVMNILDEVEDDINRNLHPADRDFFERLSQKREQAILGKNDKRFDATLGPQRRSSRGTGWMVPSLYYPRRGDITGEIVSIDGSSSINTSSMYPVALKRTPRMPYVKRNKPNVLPPPSKRVRTSIGRPDTGCIAPTYDPMLASIMDAHSRLRHTGITVEGLKQLAKDSRHWTGALPLSEETSVNSQVKAPQHMDGSKGPSSSNEPTSMNREAKEKKETEWKNSQKAEAEQKKKMDEEKRLSQAQNKQEEDSAKQETNQDDLSLSEDPRFSKYFKMLKLGMPREQVLHALKRDEQDPSILDLDPTKSLKSQQTKSEIDDSDPPLNKHEKYSKYFKMLKLGMPREQVLHAMKRDDINPFILDLDQSKSLKSQEHQLAKTSAKDNEEAEDDVEPVLKEDPKYSKYFRMLKMSLPMGAVKNAMVRDGLDPGIMDLDHNKSVKSQLGNNVQEEKDIGIPLKDDPDYAKYFKMEKMGLPRDAVRNALVRDGLDPAIIDLDPNQSVAFQLKKKTNAAGSLVSPTKPAKKKKVRRKKIYWNPIDPKKLNEDSMWNIVRDAITMDKLKYDEKEFEELFTESADQPKAKKTSQEKEKKKLVQAIDPKRSMNGGIVLSRLRTDHKKIAEYVDRMDHGKFDSTQLKALKEYLPDPDERRGLLAYMKKGEKSEDERKSLFADLSETEKYMVTMMEVEDAAAKLDAMMFRSVFKSRCEDITTATKTLNLACDELRSSEKLRKLMAVILTVVNQINTGGEGKAAMGFTLDALLKLNEAKAFDRKTSVLHYVVKLVKKNDESLLNFENDLCHVIPAESVLLDGVATDVKAIQEELACVLPIVQKEAERLELKGETRKMTLAELAEQRTMVVGSHFNRVEHLTGRTPMERFTLTARVACESAEQSIQEVQKKYSKLLNYFGEDEKMATGDFFGILRRFMAEFKKAIEQVEKIEKAEAKEKKRADARASKAGKQFRGKGLKNHHGTQQSSGGIAALAAAAARKKNQPKIETKLDKGPKAKVSSEEEFAKDISFAESSAKITAAGTADKTIVAKQQATKIAMSTLASSPISQNMDLSKISELHGQREVDASDTNDSTAESAFASKASAYRNEKEQKHEEEKLKDVGGSKFLSSLSSYRKNKAKSTAKDSDQKAAAEETKETQPASNSKDKEFDVPNINNADLEAPSDSKDEEADVPIMDNQVVPTEDQVPSLPLPEPASVLSTPTTFAAVNEKPVTESPAEERTMPSSPFPLKTNSGMFEENPAAAAAASLSEPSVDNSRPVSLDNFFARQQVHDIRNEVLRQNFDDTSVAIMAEHLENQQLSSQSNEEAWNESGGIGDYIVWAEGLRRQSDTDSVAAFEESRNLDFNYDYDDESTIASAYYDGDDASIASSNMSARQPSHFSFDSVNITATDNFSHQGEVLHESYGAHPSVTAKVAASILFNDSDAESSVAAHQVPGSLFEVAGHGTGYQNDGLLNISLAFDRGIGMDAGFDDGLGFGGVEDAGLGGFGMTSSLDPTGWHGYGMSSSPVGGNALSVDPGLQSFSGSFINNNEGQSGDFPNDEDGNKTGEATTPKTWFQWAKGA